MKRNFDSLCNFFRDVAAEGYSTIDNFVEDYGLGQPKPLPEHLGYFHSLAALQDVESSFLRAAQSQYEAIGYEGFSYVTCGSTALCFFSNGKAVRAGPVPRAGRLVEGSRMSWVRNRNPLIVQPEYVIHGQKAGVDFELLPLLIRVRDWEIPEEFTRLLPAILDGTCFMINMENKDLGVLPDGTPLYIDPGAITLKSWGRQPTVEDFKRIRENCERLGLPEMLSWVLPDGRFKQELFFSQMKQTSEYDVVI